MTVKTGTKTVYEQQCSTVYQEKCSGHGYKQTCAPAPTQKCQQVQEQAQAQEQKQEQEQEYFRWLRRSPRAPR